MNNDDFLDSLKADWKEREVDLGSVRQGMEQREKELRQAITKARLSIIMFIAGAAVFAWIAWVDQEALAALGAVAFLVAAPFQLIELRMHQRVVNTDYLADGQSLLEGGLRHARSRLRLLRFARWVSGFLLLFALMAFGLAFLGLTSVSSAAVIGAAWAVAGLASYLLQRNRLAQAKSEVASYQAMLAEFPAEDEY